MLPRPDSQTFTRFIVSIGAFLCVAAFVVPGLILRDTDVLRVSTSQLSALTSTGRAEIERRQRVARTAGTIAPFGGAVLLLGGIGLLVLAVPRLQRQERTDEARSTAELAQLQAAIEPQSEEERERTLEADARAEAGMGIAREVPVETPVEPEPPAAEAPVEPIRVVRRSLSFDMRDRINRARAVEERVLGRIQALQLSRYDVSRNVKLERTHRNLLLDGLLVSRTDDLPDLLLEIKYTTSFRQNLGNRLDEAIAKVVRYRKQVGRVAQVWLIIVTEQRPAAPDREWAQSLARELAGELILSVVWEGEIDTLKVPWVDLS